MTSEVDPGVEQTSQIETKSSTAVRLTLEQLTLQLNENQSNRPKAKIKINDLHASVETENDCLKAKGKLASLILLDISQSKGLYSDRFMTSGDEAFEFEFLKYQGCPLLVNEIKNEFEACLKLRTSSFKYVHSQQFIAWLSAYFQQFNQLQDALGKMRALASGMRDLSSFQAQRSSRIKLNIKGEAPIIIIPQNRRSKEGLVFNLGKIEVKNRFERRGPGGRKSGETVSGSDNVSLDSGQMAEIMAGEKEERMCLLDLIDVKFKDAHLYSARLYEYPNERIQFKTESEIMSMLKHDDYGTVRLLSCYFR